MEKQCDILEFDSHGARLEKVRRRLMVKYCAHLSLNSIENTEHSSTLEECFSNLRYPQQAIFCEYPHRYTGEFMQMQGTLKTECSMVLESDGFSHGFHWLIHRYDIVELCKNGLLKCQYWFTWKDDYTQHIIENELSNIHKIYNRPSESLPSEVSSNTKGQKINSESDRNYESNRNFAKSFHQYLQHLGILPQPVAPSYYPRIKSEKPPITNYRGKPGLLFAPASQQKVPAMSPKTLSKPLADKPPKESEAEAEKKTLLAALKAYLAQKPVLHKPDNPNPNGRAKVSSVYSSKYHNPQHSQLDKVLPKDDEEDTYQMQSFLQRPRVLSRPRLGALVYKSRQEGPKEPLSPVDETFIQNVVKELGKHKLNIDNLSPKEVDELADVIADTLQIVDGEQVGPRNLETESRESHDEHDRGVNTTFEDEGTSTKLSETKVKFPYLQKIF
ncbi:receptor-type tyrosine-protein phosphatase N2-like [Gastrophryne carolinensis]